MDEAFVEALVVKHGLIVRYAPDAVVYNTGPTTIPDFVRQRRRNHAGHLYLKHRYGYAVSSIQNRRVARVAFKEVWGAVQLIWILFLLGSIEGYSRVMGWYDFAVKRDRHVVWNMAWTQKQDVQSVRQTTRPEGSRPFQARPAAPARTQGVPGGERIDDATRGLPPVPGV
jgi:hypothetical protein